MWIVLFLVVAGASAAVSADMRIIVVPPANGQPGKTIVARGLRELRFVDSPEAYCSRWADEDPTCPASFRLAIAREGKVLLELPYIEALQGFAGTPQSADPVDKTPG